MSGARPVACPVALWLRSIGPLPLWTLTQRTAPNICDRCKQPWVCEEFQRMSEEEG